MITLQIVDWWPKTAYALTKALSGDATDLMNLGRLMATRDMERQAISCNDRLPFEPPSAEEVIDESLFVLKNVSRFGMAVMTTEPDSGCEYWPFNPPERFQGPWNHTLSNPILIHSNTVRLSVRKILL